MVFTRLLTPVLQLQVDSGWIHRNWPTARTSGFATTDVGIKSEIYRNNQHEMLVAAGLLWGIGHSDAQVLGADEPNSILPGVFFGKGLGDLPDCLAWPLLACAFGISAVKTRCSSSIAGSPPYPDVLAQKVGTVCGWPANFAKLPELLRKSGSQRRHLIVAGRTRSLPRANAATK